MALNPGDPARPFALPRAPGESVDVGALLGEEKVVLLFFPLAFSSVCTTEMCRIRDDWSAWEELEARVFGISVDSPFVTEKFRREHELPFPILSDFNREVSRRYGVLAENMMGLRGVANRSAFAIDEEGRIAYAWVSEDPGREPDYAAIRAALA